MWVEAPDGERDALLLEVFRDMVGVHIGRHDRNMSTSFRLEAVADLRADDGVGVGHIAEILLPLLLPRQKRRLLLPA